ncbi:hypothetical protein EAS64_33755 [Trebonia kvetii]|uniref:Uncharacterized protein n=1 Tax=Trebonia kvetii TaxID=2480626 RepID=A0A6P2BRE9_9ACTN|nr:hypothetical protein [Trebonia kvetii]TVZ01247.1 hypothetical protein EAS64_33755 [Trebonia kvetii]
MEEKFKAGQRVHVEYDGEVVFVSGAFALFEVKGPDGRNHTYGEGVTITLADPENWPPQAGDIWEAEGMEYFIRAAARGLIASPQSTTLSAFPLWDETVNDRAFLDLNPVLVRRRGSQM